MYYNTVGILRRNDRAHRNKYFTVINKESRTYIMFLSVETDCSALILIQGSGFRLNCIRYFLKRICANKSEK